MGLGYIGLPTAITFAEYGYQVHGTDTNPAVIEALNQKSTLHIEEPGLEEKVKTVIESGSFTFSRAPEKSDAFIIAVPTPITDDNRANLDYVESATEMILPFLEKGNVVILESTVPPLTIEKVMKPIVESRGFKAGEDIYLAHSPERVMPGKLFQELIENDRIIGGFNDISGRKAGELYASFVKGNIHYTDAATAEMVKLMENTYRDVNIALANELARISERIGADVWEAIRLANYHPRVNLHQPGPGVGGHCIAVDPWFLVEAAPEEAQLIKMSRYINNDTPFQVVNRVKEMMDDFGGKKLTVLGLAYKGETGDARESPSLVIVNELIRAGYDVSTYDPYVQEGYSHQAASLEEAAADSDMLVILTNHKQFSKIDFSTIGEQMEQKMILDAKNMFTAKQIRQHGFHYYQIGVKQSRLLGDKVK
ncbi:UDP-N-acetyl-D-mannosamine dehydrogenase [Alteribacter lacisalsi]|uniref:UDP-N-acetyl-D-mannosamine dehydrogenase n=1 Tax=Alteribacter lacisalsi TaxID=2045244 RepID=A0A2W0HFY1_9BACI|nr:UDP-N-acetyl-D-mannosamine dehydrogenase [Alteribacter lacisalsi]